VATQVTETVRATGRARMPADHKTGLRVGMPEDHKTGLWVGMPEDHVGERGMVGMSSGEALTDVPGGNRRSWQR
jgi:hypothetical protein